VSPLDYVAQKLPPDHPPTGSCDSCSEEDVISHVISHLGQKLKRRRVNWQTGATWDPRDVEEQQIQEFILSHACEYMHSSVTSGGLPEEEAVKP
jgi:ribosomal protein L20A (L18A)